MTDFESKKKAKNENKTLLLDFSGSIGAAGVSNWMKRFSRRMHGRLMRRSIWFKF